MSDGHTGRSTGLVSEADFERYLGGETELSRGYRAASAETPRRSLDAAIVSAARGGGAGDPTQQAEVQVRDNPFRRAWQALRLRPGNAAAGAGPARGGRFALPAPFGARWGLPVLAATAAIVASVVLLLQPQVALDDDAILSEPAPPATATGPASGAAGRAAPQAEGGTRALDDLTKGRIGGLPAADSRSGQSAAAPGTLAPAERPPAGADRATGESMAAPATPLAPTAEQIGTGEAVQGAKAELRSTDTALQTPGRGTSVAASSPRQQLRDLPEDAAAAGPQPPAGVAGDADARAALARELLERSEVARRRLETKRRQVAEERARLAPAVAASSQSAAATAGEDAPAALRRITPAPAAAPAPPTGLLRPPPAASEQRLTPALQLALDRVRTLLDEGRLVDARAALQRFAQLAPGVPVPDDIRAALGTP